MLPTKISPDSKTYFLRAIAPSAPKKRPPNAGKWLVYSEPSAHDAVWLSLKKAVEADQHGIMSARAQTAAAIQSKHKRMLCEASVVDAENTEQIRTALAGIREIGVVGKVVFRTDADHKAHRKGFKYWAKHGSNELLERADTPPPAKKPRTGEVLKSDSKPTVRAPKASMASRLEARLSTKRAAKAFRGEDGDTDTVGIVLAKTPAKHHSFKPVLTEFDEKPSDGCILVGDERKPIEEACKPRKGPHMKPSDFYDNFVKVSQEDAQRIECMPQRSAGWLQARKYRLTASQFAAFVGRGYKTPD